MTEVSILFSGWRLDKYWQKQYLGPYLISSKGPQTIEGVSAKQFSREKLLANCCKLYTIKYRMNAYILTYIYIYIPFYKSVFCVEFNFCLKLSLSRLARDSRTVQSVTASRQDGNILQRWFSSHHQVIRHK
jgi:hypothetical protein